MHLDTKIREFPGITHSGVPNSRFEDTDYLAIMCHEIRTPLNAIIGLSDILSGQMYKPEKQKIYADMLNDSSKMLMELLNDLLDSFKLYNGKIELEHIVFDLTKLLEEAKNIIAVKAEEKGLDIHIRIGKGLQTWFVGDPLRIRQILLNLLANAVKFTNNGSISLYVTEGEVVNGHSEVCITVADCGIGIEKEKLGKLFGMYTQADTSTSREYGGTGLGLFISQSLIHLMNGTIRVKSWPNIGSHFIVTLPLQKAQKLKIAA